MRSTPAQAVKASLDLTSGMLRTVAAGVRIESIGPRIVQLGRETIGDRRGADLPHDVMAERPAVAFRGHEAKPRVQPSQELRGLGLVSAEGRSELLDAHLGPRDDQGVECVSLAS